MTALARPLVAVLLLTPAIGRADIALLPAAADSTLYEEPFGFLANGAGDYFFAGKSDVGLMRRGIIRFDVASAVPDGAVITSAALVLHMSRTNTGPQVVSLHRTLASWTEGVTDAPGQEGTGQPTEPGDVTWAHRTFDNVFWSNLGGDFAPDPSATIFVGGVDFYEWSGEGVTADVANWAANSGENFGWILVGDEEFNTTAKRFDSRTNPEIEFQPVLRIEYIEVPAPATAGVLLGGTAVQFMRRARRARPHAR